MRFLFDRKLNVNLDNISSVTIILHFLKGYACVTKDVGGTHVLISQNLFKILPK